MIRMLITFLAAASLIAPALAQDNPAETGATSTPHLGPPGAEVLLNNASLAAIRIRLEPHEKTPMHYLSSRLVIWLTNGRIKDTLATGETKIYDAKAGDIVWVSAQRHAGENLGDKPLEWIAIVPKQAARSRAPDR